jgi:hypothetical protein
LGGHHPAPPFFYFFDFFFWPRPKNTLFALFGAKRIKIPAGGRFPPQTVSIVKKQFPEKNQIPYVYDTLWGYTMELVNTFPRKFSAKSPQNSLTL